VLDLLSSPQPSMPHLVEELERGDLRFRAAATENPGTVAAGARGRS
jgi:hypothetical protein